jgi:dolichol-phosphate mannosyltransferase
VSDQAPSAPERNTNAPMQSLALDTFDLDAAYAALRRPKVFVVLPAYNEESNVGGLIGSIARTMVEHRMPFEIVVVDDGSTDRTIDVINEMAQIYPVRLLRHEVNQGLGGTIRDGLYEASRLTSDGDIVVTMDADETHTPGLILAMVRQIQEGRDVVVASRYQPGSRVIGLTPFRVVLSLAGSFVFRLLFPTSGLRDFTCGYRAYRSTVLHRALAEYGTSFIDQDGFQCMVDILLKLRRLSIVFGEVPMILRYDMKKSVSKMRVMRTVRNTLVLIAKRRLGR